MGGDWMTEMLIGISRKLNSGVVDLHCHVSKLQKAKGRIGFILRDCIYILNVQNYIILTHSL